MWDEYPRAQTCDYRLEWFGPTLAVRFPEKHRMRIDGERVKPHPAAGSNSGACGFAAATPTGRRGDSILLL
jgi:hypothetical protein